VSDVFSKPWPAALFWATYLAFVLLDARLVLRVFAGRAVPDGGAAAHGGPVHRPGGVFWLVAGEGVALGLATLAMFRLPATTPLLVIGLVAVWLGIGLRFWAKRTLGRFFVGAVVIQDGHEVVTSGPYALIRHPGYAGSMLALVGFGVATANAASLVAFVVLSLAVFVRTIRVEERVLCSRLGEPYAEYSRHTSRLVPRLW